jgi:hypothetical protein
MSTQKDRAAGAVLAFMRERKLTLDDLIEAGGEDLKSPRPSIREKAKRVERCWALMARNGVVFAHLADSGQSAVSTPDSTGSARRGEDHFL